jgi:hypothetical protein
MEEQRQELQSLRAWMAGTPFLDTIWCGLGRPEGSLATWCERLLQDMLASGVLVQRDGVVHDR